MITDNENKPIKTKKQIKKEENKEKRKNYAAYFIAAIVFAMLVAAGIAFFSNLLANFIDTEFIQAGVVHQPKL